MSAYWDWVASGGQDETLGPSTWGNEDIDAYGTWGDPNEWVIPFDIRLQDIASSIASIPKGLWNAARSAFTNKDTGNIDWGKLVTLGGAILPLLQGSSNRPVGYQGGIPDYAAVREQVAGTYDPNRRPGSGGQRYFTDVQYVPRTGEGAAEALTAARTAASEQAQGLASLNAANPLNTAPPAYQPPAPPPATTQPALTYNDAYSGENVLKTIREMLNPPVQPREMTQADPNLPPPVTYRPSFARGGIVGLQDGGFVVPADVVSHLGNGSTDAGLAHLTRKGAVPIRGKGDGMSDSNRTTINGRQPAAVANGEAYLPPRQVQNMGGAEKLYAMMDKIRKDRTGTTKQGRQINPNQYV